MTDLSLTVRVTNLGSLRDGLRAARAQTEQEIASFLRTELDHARSTLEAGTPVKTGQMAASWEVELSGFREGIIRNTAPYSSFLLTGTRPHAIPGAFGYPLPFGEDPTFHPGTKRDQELISAFEEAARDVRAHFATVGAKVANTIARRTLASGDDR